MGYYEETEEVKEAIKGFCDKTNKFYQIEAKKRAKSTHPDKPIRALRIKLREHKDYSGKAYGNEYMEIDRCNMNDDHIEVRIHEGTELFKEDQQGRKDLHGGELWIDKQFSTPIKSDGTPLLEFNFFSMDHASSILDKMGLSFEQLKQVPKENTKYRERPKR